MIQDKNSVMHDQLSSASCADPFSFLGPYQASKRCALRVWMPGADKVELIIEGEKRLALKREGDSGFVLRERCDLSQTHYKLAVTWQDDEHILDDPYQYHEIYADYEDLHTPKRMYHHMGAQFVTLQRAGRCIHGVRFLVYAPHASACSLVGEFYQWDGRRTPMQRLDYGMWGILFLA